MAVAPGSELPKTFGWIRRWGRRGGLLLGLFLSFYILVLFNLILFRHPDLLRIDFTDEKLHTLSPRTIETLEHIGQEIRVIIPTYLQRDNPRHQAERAVLRRALLLLREYTTKQPLIKIIAQVDVFADPARWQELRTEYDLEPTQVNRFIFFTGPQSDLRQAVTPRDLARFGKPADPQRDAPEILEFMAEEAITGALLRLIEGQRRPVYFTQDHQELQLAPSNQQPLGLAAVRRELETAGYDPRPLSLFDVDAIPEDCEMLAIVTPFQSFVKRDLDKIRAYLESGGKLFVALGPNETGIETVLKEWGVEVTNGYIQEKRVVGPVERRTSASPEIHDFHRTHPITQPFTQVQNFAMRLTSPRPLEPKGHPRGLDAYSLLDLVSRPGSALFFRLLRSAPRQLPKPDDFSVAVAVEQLVPERPPPNFQRIDTRVVVVGGGSFLLDTLPGYRARLAGFSQLYHRDFLLNCMAWLSGQQERASVSGRALRERKIKMTPAINRFLFYVPVFVFPGICLVMGAFVYFVRRT